MTALLGFLSGSVVKKKSTYNAGTAGDLGLIPRSGRSPGGGHAAHSSVLAWRVPWTETGYSLWDRKELDATEVTEHAHTALLGTFFFKIYLF